MASTLLLIRHGPSTHPQSNARVNADGFQRWREAYDAAGIDPQSAPPPAALDAVAATDIVICSDLPRAKETAERLTRSKSIVATPLLRETVLEIPVWVPMRLPVSAWDGLTHMRWGYSILLKADASQRDRKRADDAIAWLSSLDSGTSSITVITHGVFRRLLAMRLQELGWHTAKGRRSYKPWSVWSFTRTT